MLRPLLLALALAVPAPALAQAGQLRELTTDRPDKTEAPQTVDSGRVQIELDVAKLTVDRTASTRTETIAVSPLNLKYGLSDSTDIQLVVSPYARQTVTDRTTGVRSRIAGFGDVTIRVKHNLWGNDGGDTALAIMPYVTLPTAREGLGAEGVDFGVIVPLAIKLSDGIDLGLMTEVDAVRENGRYRANFVNSATLGFSLTEKLGLYTEIYTERGEDWIVTADAGLTFALGDNGQLDTGVNLGLTDAADDVEVFVGVSRRF